MSDTYENDEALQKIKAQAWAEGVEAAVEACDYGMLNYGVLDKSGNNIAPLHIQNAAKGLVGIVRQDILKIANPYEGE